MTRSTIAVLASVGFLAGFGVDGASADAFNFRIASGHAPGVVYVDLMRGFFQAELAKRVEERTDHTITFTEGYSGSIVKTNETLEGVRDGNQLCVRVRTHRLCVNLADAAGAKQAKANSHGAFPLERTSWNFRTNDALSRASTASKLAPGAFE